MRESFKTDWGILKGAASANALLSRPAGIKSGNIFEDPFGSTKGCLLVKNEKEIAEKKVVKERKDSFFGSDTKEQFIF